MADGNGKSVDGMTLPRKTVLFRIGSEDVAVPAIGFLDLDFIDEPLQALSPTIPAREYVGHVLRIVAHQLAATRPELGLETLRARLLAGEANELIPRMNDLLRVSGFQIPEAVTPPPAEASPGTGTSTGSAPSSPSAASAGDTPSS